MDRTGHRAGNVESQGRYPTAGQHVLIAALFVPIKVTTRAVLSEV